MKTLKRRRKENKTDYGKRFKLLKSGKARLVFRKTNLYLMVQYIESKEAKDKVVFGINSKELIKFGFPENASLKNIPASYLLGYLTAKKIQEKKLGTPIVDFGMLRSIYKNKLYAFLKGLIDGGLEINCKKEAFPDESRIKGKHLKNKINFDEIKAKIK